MGDNQQIRYEMSNKNGNNLFKINRKSGEVYVRRALVDTANQEFVFQVTATDQGALRKKCLCTSLKLVTSALCSDYSVNHNLMRKSRIFTANYDRASFNLLGCLFSPIYIQAHPKVLT